MPWTELLLAALVWTVLSFALAPLAGRLLVRRTRVRPVLTLRIPVDAVAAPAGCARHAA